MHTDFIVGLFELKDCDSTYTVVDRLSKHARFIPCSTTVTAEGVAQLFADRVWKHNGFRRNNLAYRVPQSVNVFRRTFMERLGMDHNITIAKHPARGHPMELTTSMPAKYVRLYAQQNPVA